MAQFANQKRDDEREEGEKGETLKAGVIGFPIDHSRSPKIHGYWLKLHDINGSYDARAVEPENLSPLIRSLADDGYRGINVTVPHKEAVMVLMDRVDPFAERVGAVNTVVVEDDGSLTGSNTDGFGFIENLKSRAQSWQADQAPAVVLGAGGAARAVLAALLDEGVPEIRLANRSLDRAQALAAEIKMADGSGAPITVRPFEDRAQMLDGAGLVVNTTSMGLKGDNPLDLDFTLLPQGAVVTDLVYAPLETKFLADAAAAGHQTVDGLGMLLHQARPGFEAWFGKAPKVTAMLRALIVQDIENEEGDG